MIVLNLYQSLIFAIGIGAIGYFSSSVYLEKFKPTLSSNKNSIIIETMRRLNVLLKNWIFLLSLLVMNIPADAEVVRTGKVNEVTKAKSVHTISARENRSDSCPKALVEWVQDDFENKSWNFGLIKLPGEREKQCLKIVKDYEEKLKNQKGTAPALSDAEQLTKGLAQRNPKITSNYSLDTCNKLKDGQDQVAKTRYYSAMTKIEAANSTILDEIANYDSLLEGERKTNSLYCNPAYPFPQVGKKCQEYKSKLNTKECIDRRQEQIESYTTRTMKALDDLRELRKAREECFKVNGKPSCKADQSDSASFEFATATYTCTGGETGKCAALSGMISMIEAKYPWIKGKTFVNYAGEARWGREKDTGKIREMYKKGIQAQLKEDRDIYVKQYEHNIENANCLTFSDSRGNAKCDFKELRRELSYMPNMKQPSPRGGGTAAIEMQTRDDAESCIIDNSENRENFKDQAIESQFIAATVLSVAIPIIGMPAGRMVSGISALTKFKNINIARGSLAAASTLSLGALEVYEGCEKAGKEVFKSSVKEGNEKDSDLGKDNLCPASTSIFEQSVEAYDDCVLGVVLASVDVWPFVKALKMTERFISGANKELLAVYKTPEQHKRIEEILAKNGNMSEAERKAAAEELLGRKLSPQENDCVIAMHNKAAGKAMNTAANVAAGAELLDQSDLFGKGLGGKRCGFSSTESALLMRSGITGSNPTNDEIRTNISRSFKYIMGHDPTSEEINAIFNNLFNFDAQRSALQRLGSSAADKYDKIAVVSGDQRNTVRLIGESRSPAEAKKAAEAAEAKKLADAEIEKQKAAAKPAALTKPPEPAAPPSPPPPKPGSFEWHQAERKKQLDEAIQKGVTVGRESGEKNMRKIFDGDIYYARGNVEVVPDAINEAVQKKAQADIQAEARRNRISSDDHMRNSIHEAQDRVYKFQREIAKDEARIKELSEANRIEPAKIQEAAEQLEKSKAWLEAEKKKCRGILATWLQAGWVHGPLYQSYNPKTMKSLCYE